MKHAFLIIAHNNFKVLDNLIKALDCKGNDIFVHIDKKVRDFPKFEAHHVKLFLIEDRKNVRWGHVSQIEAEFALIENALNQGKYDYLHIISGTHFPLKSQKSIDDFFNGLNGHSVFSPILCGEDIKFKLGYHHLFFGGQNDGLPIKRYMCNLLWRICLRLQKCSKSRINELFKGKYSQWVSLSGKDAETILPFKKIIMRKFRHTFCGDELFMPKLFDIIGLSYVTSSNLLFQKFPGASPAELTTSDFPDILNSNCLFTRKITDAQIGLIDMIEENKKSIHK